MRCRSGFQELDGTFEQKNDTRKKTTAEYGDAGLCTNGVPARNTHQGGATIDVT